ncbi:MAG: C4-type zinc ribbon domain-containing protein [Acidobacteriota bacterium]|nr:C4-type zinc ribbon domain-containing protein [Blastocatellia bacterium]MDW8238853.1 C4-type zinc ribbon domain-containing protein [Acidobacteriota bacterium]
MKSELQKLIALQELDIKIRQVEREIANLPSKKAEIENQFNAIATDYLDKKNRYETTLQERRQAELKLKELEDKLDKYKQDLMRVKNEREYVSVLREIDVTKKAASALETQILEKIEQLEQLEKELDVLKPDIEIKRREFDAKIEECVKQIEKLKVDLCTWQQQRQELVATVPPDILNRYNRLAQLRDGLALAEVRDGSCTACFMTVRPQAYADVRRGDMLINCDNCGRILYYKHPAPMQESRSAG